MYPMEAVDIAVADRCDSTTILDLWEQCRLTRPWNDAASDLDKLFSFPEADVLVARHHGRIVGSVVAQWDGHRGWIAFLRVDPANWGSGVGSELVHEAERRLHVKGAPAIQLLIRDDNRKVGRFYSQLGYTPAESTFWHKRL